MPGNYGPPFMRLARQSRDEAVHEVVGWRPADDCDAIKYADGVGVRVGACIVAGITGVVTAGWTANTVKVVRKFISAPPRSHLSFAGLQAAIDVGGTIFCLWVSFEAGRRLWSAFTRQEWVLHKSAATAELRKIRPFSRMKTLTIHGHDVAGIEFKSRPWYKTEPRALYCEVTIKMADGSSRWVDGGREETDLLELAKNFASALNAPLKQELA